MIILDSLTVKAAIVYVTGKVSQENKAYELLSLIKAERIKKGSYLIDLDELEEKFINMFPVAPEFIKKYSSIESLFYEADYQYRELFGIPQ